MRTAKACTVPVYDWRGRMYRLPVPAGTDVRRVRRMARRAMQDTNARAFLGGERVHLHVAARWVARWGIEYS